jgi:hypothetical protein
LNSSSFSSSSTFGVASSFSTFLGRRSVSKSPVSPHFESEYFSSFWQIFGLTPSHSHQVCPTVTCEPSSSLIHSTEFAVLLSLSCLVFSYSTLLSPFVISFFSFGASRRSTPASSRQSHNPNGSLRRNAKIYCWKRHWLRRAS